MPLLVAVFSIPVLIKELGEARFGLLTLIWAVVSYFGLFDLGLGRALTQQLSVALANQDHQRVGPLIGTASALMALLGVLAGVLLAMLADWGVGHIQFVPDPQETIHAVYWMAAAMPAIVLTSGFRGILEASHRFGVINLIRLPMGLFTFIGPLFVVLLGSTRLDVITSILAIGRLLACFAHALCAWQALRGEHRRLAVKQQLLMPLCVSGGWLTLSNVISPFMGYVDRFVIAGLASAAAVAYYTTPQEIVTKLWILPGALTAVLFPAFAVEVTKIDCSARELFNKSVYWLYCALLPITAGIALFSNEILSVWVSAEFARNSALLLQIFSAGVLVNCLAHVPFTLIQAAGKPRLTALVHAAELPVFMVALWLLTSSYGVIGAAIAWFMRMTVDAIVMFYLCSSVQAWPLKNLINFKIVGFILLAALSFFGLVFQMSEVRALWLFATGLASATLMFIANVNLKIFRA